MTDEMTVSLSKDCIGQGPLGVGWSLTSPYFCCKIHVPLRSGRALALIYDHGQQVLLFCMGCGFWSRAHVQQRLILRTTLLQVEYSLNYLYSACQDTGLFQSVRDVLSNFKEGPFYRLYHSQIRIFTNLVTLVRLCTVSGLVSKCYSTRLWICIS